MNRRTLIISTIVAVAALAIVPLVYAQAHGHHGRGHGDAFGIMAFGHLEKAKEALGLTDEQVNQIKTIAGDLRQQNASYRGQLRGGYQAVIQALLNNPNDIAAAQAILDQHAVAERAMKSNMLTAASKALNVLTADQRAKVTQFMSERQARHNR